MKCMQKMSVIAKISRYFERSVVTLKLRKKCLNTVTYNLTPDKILNSLVSVSYTHLTLPTNREV